MRAVVKLVTEIRGVVGMQDSERAAVLNHLAKHQQSDRDSSEAGGQLFARFKGEQIRVERATGPRATDRRSRYGYIPDRRVEQEEID